MLVLRCIVRAMIIYVFFWLLLRTYNIMRRTNLSPEVTELLKSYSVELTTNMFDMQINVHYNDKRW